MKLAAARFRTIDASGAVELVFLFRKRIPCVATRPLWPLGPSKPLRRFNRIIIIP
jgi:hypothetical protein